MRAVFWPTLKTYPLEKKSLRVLSFVALIPLKTSKGDEFGACQRYGKGSQFNNSPDQYYPPFFSILLKCPSILFVLLTFWIERCMYSLGQELFYKFVNKITIKLVKQLLSMTVDTFFNIVSVSVLIHFVEKYLYRRIDTF